MFVEYIREITTVLLILVFIHTFYICYKLPDPNKKKNKKVRKNVYIEAHQKLDENYPNDFNEKERDKITRNLSNFYDENE